LLSFHHAAANGRGVIFCEAGFCIFGDGFAPFGPDWEKFPVRPGTAPAREIALHLVAQRLKAISRRWHGDCNHTRMSPIHSSSDAALASSASGHRAEAISGGASRAGRELVWLFIAVAFCVVEAFVFVTDLPVSKFFGRRELQKSSGARSERRLAA
jgi:hypothetical protein